MTDRPHRGRSETRCQVASRSWSIRGPTREDGKRGLILRHPYWSTIADSKNPPLYYAEAVVEWADSASTARSIRRTGGLRRSGGHWRCQHARHPQICRVVARIAPSGSRRTGVDRHGLGDCGPGTARRSDAPVRDLQWRLSYGALGATVFVLCSSRGSDDWDDVSTGWRAEIAHYSCPAPLGWPSHGNVIGWKHHDWNFG